jgi:hypothetical protein
MIHEKHDYELLTNTIVTILVSMVLGGLAGALTMLLPAR